MGKQKSREEYIDFFDQLTDCYTYIDDPDTLNVYIISYAGLYKGFSTYVSPVYGPEKVPQEEYTEIAAAIKKGENLDAFDEDHVSMIQSGCKSDMDYYRWSSDFWDGFGNNWYTKEEMLSDLQDAIVLNVEPLEWSQMDEGELEYWYEELIKIQHEKPIHKK